MESTRRASVASDRVLCDNRETRIEGPVGATDRYSEHAVSYVHLRSHSQPRTTLYSDEGVPSLGKDGHIPQPVNGALMRHKKTYLTIVGLYVLCALRSMTRNEDLLNVYSTAECYLALRLF
jgi:hypothetical protein